MPGKKENEEVTAEEYRQKAQEQIHELKDQWKIFFRTGIIILAAVIVIIAVSIAWFTMNNQVEATGTSIQAAGSEFELAAAGTGAASTKGAYDALLEVSPGAELNVGNKSCLSTDGSHTAISWAITADSNMRNESDQPQGIEPGSSGQMTFYIISHKQGMLDVKLDLNVTGYQVTGDPVSATDLKKIDEPAQQLLEGHILLFAGYDEKLNSYKGWISEDAGSWSMNLGTESEPISLQEDGNGELTWKTENAKKDTAYPVTVYWIWPERLESYLMKAGSTHTGKYPLLFPDDAKENDTGNPSALPANLFTKMCETGTATGTNAGSNRYFRWENQETFGKTVNAGTLLGLRNEFHSFVYREAAAYYDSADQYLGKNVQYVKLKLTAE